MQHGRVWLAAAAPCAGAIRARQSCAPAPPAQRVSQETAMLYAEVGAEEPETKVEQEQVVGPLEVVGAVGPGHGTQGRREEVWVLSEAAA